MIEVLKENVSLFERRPEAWPLVLMLDRLEKPLHEMRSRALELQEAGDARSLLLWCGGAAGGCAEYSSKAEDATWLHDRASGLRLCVEALESLINAELESALGPPGVEADPLALDRLCSQILFQLEKCMELEREIVSERLHPDLEDAQFAFAGLTADFVASHQELVEKIREFVESEGGTSFSFTVKLNADRLASAFSNGSQAGVPPPLLQASSTSGKDVSPAYRRLLEIRCTSDMASQPEVG